MTKRQESVIDKGINAIPVEMFMPIIVVLFMAIIGGIYLYDKKHNKDICMEKYSQYEIDFCASNIEGIKVCESLGGRLIRTRRGWVDTYVCKINESIVSI